MPRQNRVTPTGEIVATSSRGKMMGNRGGCFHDDYGNLMKRHWATKAWICCVLEYGNQRRTVMTPKRYTELFFTDEAVALAAGHRPCGQCRNADYKRFKSTFAEIHPRLKPSFKALDMDRILHGERIDAASGAGLLHTGFMEELPDGAFYYYDPDGPPIVNKNGRALEWSFDGYREYSPIRKTEVSVITPPSIVECLRRGYRPNFAQGF